LRAIADRTHRFTAVASTELRAAGLDVAGETWFNTLTVRVPGGADRIVAAALGRGLNLRHDSTDVVGFSLDETTTAATLAALREIADRTHRFTAVASTELRAAGLDVAVETWFDTLTVRVPGGADRIVAAALGRGLNLRHDSPDVVGFSLDETTTAATLAALLGAFGIERDPADLQRAADAVDGLPGIPAPLQRSSGYLEHPTFHRYRSETSMMRYLRELADKDLALDRTMIPLGSCTMKLNAAAEMVPITWPEFADVHPFVPQDQAQGYLEMIRELESALATITGYDAVSVQPNAGSQGELAGLL